MRKPKLLSIIPNSTDGTALYRAMPYERIDSIDVIRGSGKKLKWSDLYNIDIVFFQRPATQLNVIDIETCKKFNKKVVIDYDDYCFDIKNESNPAYEYYCRDAIHAVMRECLKQADVVTASTQALKEALLEQVPSANIKVVPNAVDDKIFHTEPLEFERNKIILMRGGGSHYYDWLEYKDSIKQILKDNPGYKLAVIGFHPPFLKEFPGNQIQYYEFSDVATYFHNLMQLKPEIMLVPLKDDKFNRCKSNIALIEGSLAGAAVIASNLPEFAESGACVFETGEQLKTLTNELISDSEIRNHYYETQLSGIPKLSNVNELRLDIIEELVNSTKKYIPNTPITEPATAKQFHDHNLSHGNSIENPDYAKGHTELVDFLISKVRPKTVLELGCGVGGTLVEFLKRGVVGYGIEINPHSVEYFREHHPVFANQVQLGDITTEPLENDVKGDLVYSIEVFEHLPVTDEWLKSYFLELSKKFRHFYFTSTPYHTAQAADFYWGHINLKRSSEWIRLFEESGWKFVSNPKALINWDLLLESTN